MFADILTIPSLREQLQPLLEKVAFLKEYGSFGKESDASGMWDLIHSLHEMEEYITCVEAIHRCLADAPIHSEGCGCCATMATLYEQSGFAALKQDVAELKVEASKVKSVTMGVNLNEKFEPNGVGLISINSKAFTKTGILSNFCDFLSRQDELTDDIERDPGMSMHGIKSERTAPVVFPTPGQPLLNPGSAADDTMRVMDRIVSLMLASTVRKLRNLLSKHSR